MSYWRQTLIGGSLAAGRRIKLQIRNGLIFAGPLPADARLGERRHNTSPAGALNHVAARCRVTLLLHPGSHLKYRLWKWDAAEKAARTEASTSVKPRAGYNLQQFPWSVMCPKEKYQACHP